MAKIDLKDNEFFEKFIGPEPVSSHDNAFWYQLLSCSFNFSRISSQLTKEKHVDETLRPFIDALALNNSQSLNIGALTRVAIDRVSRIRPLTSNQGQQHQQPATGINPFYGFQSLNSIFLLRLICKNIIESSSEEMLVQAFRARIDEPPQVPKAVAAQQPIAPPPHLLKPADANDQAQTPRQQQQKPNEPNPVTINGQDTNQPSQNQITTTQSSAAVASANPTTNNAISPPQAQAAKVLEITPGANMLDQYISTLVSLIVDMPLSDSTYLLQVEAVNSLIVLLSVQMFSAQVNQSYVFRTLMHKKCSIHALVLTKTLLNNFIRQDPLPQESGSLILGAAWVIEKTLWKVLTLGFGGNLEDEDAEEGLPLLARQSLLLLNILTNHNTSGKNPYREAIVSCQDSKFSLSDPKMAFDNANNDLLATATTSQSIMASNSIKIEFNELFDTICKNLHNRQVALVLYLLLHNNKIFKPFILTTCAGRLDQLMLPLLKILYTSIQKGSHAIYLIVILFVMLSEEESFSKSIHTIHLKGQVPWFTDRTLNDISLGSFTILILIRSFQYNIFRVKDKFLNTNLYAILANLSNHFVDLHPYICVRIVDLLERLTKRYTSIVKPTKPQEHIVKPPRRALYVLNSDNPLARALATDTQRQELQDVSSIELDSTSANYSNTMASYQQNGNANAINISIPDSTTGNTSNMNTDGAHTSPLNNGIGQDLSNNSSINDGQQSPGSSNSEHVNITMDDSKVDLEWLEECIRLMLEIINNSFAVQLSNNSDLIYTLLYKRYVVNSLMSSHKFYDQSVNIERILAFFYNKIEAFQEKQLSVEEIKSIILSSTKSWNFDQTRDPNNQLLFRYVEDSEPHQFFNSFIWEDLFYTSGISWNSKRIVLFNPEMA